MTKSCHQSWDCWLAGILKHALKQGVIRNDNMNFQHFNLKQIIIHSFTSLGGGPSFLRAQAHLLELLSLFLPNHSTLRVTSS